MAEVPAASNGCKLARIENHQIQWVFAVSLLYSSALTFINVINVFGFSAVEPWGVSIHIGVLFLFLLLLPVLTIVDLLRGRAGWRFLLPACLLSAGISLGSLVDEWSSRSSSDFRLDRQEPYLWATLLVFTVSILTFFGQRLKLIRTYTPAIDKPWSTKWAALLIVALSIHVLWRLLGSFDVMDDSEVWLAMTIPVAASGLVMVGWLGGFWAQNAISILCLFWLMVTVVEHFVRPWDNPEMAVNYWEQMGPVLPALCVLFLCLQSWKAWRTARG